MIATPAAPVPDSEVAAVLSDPDDAGFHAWANDNPASTNHATAPQRGATNRNSATNHAANHAAATNHAPANEAARDDAAVRFRGNAAVERSASAEMRSARSAVAALGGGANARDPTTSNPSTNQSSPSGDQEEAEESEFKLRGLITKDVAVKFLFGEGAIFFPENFIFCCVILLLNACWLLN